MKEIRQTAKTIEEKLLKSKSEVERLKQQLEETRIQAADGEKKIIKTLSTSQKQEIRALTDCLNEQKSINKDLKESLKESQEEITKLEFSSNNASQEKAETLELDIISKEKMIASLELEIKQMNEMMQRKQQILEMKDYDSSRNEMD